MRRLAHLSLAAGIAASALLPAPAVPAPARVRVEADPGASLLVHGEYPRSTSRCVNAEQPLLHARYRGTVEVRKQADGSLSLIGELGFEDYVKGIAEVPRSWHMEALRAQVIAARTYAMRRLQLGTSGGPGYDLCATTACQVYLGMGVEAGPHGERWVEAVDQTAGQVLLYQGKPADTLYSSTSPGYTLGNEVVFGGEPLPYLRPMKETDDTGSPVSRWTVRIPLPDLARFLSAQGLWPGGPITETTIRKTRMVLRGGGEKLNITNEDLRDVMNAVAACLDADYPARRKDGSRLPQAVPSDWFTASRDGDDLLLEGRGWGHAVGMVQWGAKGKADRGLDHREILAAYYGGLRPAPVRTPDTIRVLIAEGLTRVTIAPRGQARLVSGGTSGPPWLVKGGKRLRVLTGEMPPPSLRVRSGEPALGSEGIEVPVRLSSAARIRLEVVDGDEVVETTPWRPLEEGPGILRETLTASGDVLRVAADDGIDVVRAPVGAAPAAAPTATAAPSPAEAAPPAAPASRGTSPAAWAAVPLVLLLALAAVWLIRRSRTGAHRP